MGIRGSAMPMYEYQCKKCGVFEIYQSIKDDALVKCPTCKSKVERLISANVGFVLKGSGFYQNDYKKPEVSKEKPKAQNKSDEPAHSSGSTEMGHSGPSSASGQANTGPDCSKCPGPEACGN